MGAVPVVICDKPGRPPLNPFKSPNVDLMVGVPHCAGILQCWPNHCLVSHRLNLGLTSMEIPFDESQGSVGLGSDVGDMLVPTELVVDGYAQVFCTVDFL